MPTRCCCRCLTMRWRRYAACARASDAAFEVILRASEAYGYWCVVALLRRVEGAAGRWPSGDGSNVRLAARWRAHAPHWPAWSSLQASDRARRRPSDRGVGGIAFHLRPTTFFQVNSAAAEALLGLVREGLALRGGERLLDLYCGAGAFALPLAAVAAEVLGIEEYAGGG